MTSPEALERFFAAVVGRVVEKGGFVTKTKLVKYLYLFDLRYFLRHGATWSGVSWIYHLYGPYFSGFDESLAAAEKHGWVALARREETGQCATFVNPARPASLHDLGLGITDSLAAMRIADTWASVATAEMLAHVYFETAPMETARRGQLLDFSSAREMSSIESRIAIGSTSSPDHIRSARDRIRAALKEKPDVRRREPVVRELPPDLEAALSDQQSD